MSLCCCPGFPVFIFSAAVQVRVVLVVHQRRNGKEECRDSTNDPTHSHSHTRSSPLPWSSPTPRFPVSLSLPVRLSSHPSPHRPPMLSLLWSGFHCPTNRSEQSSSCTSSCSCSRSSCWCSPPSSSSLVRFPCAVHACLRASFSAPL